MLAASYNTKKDLRAAIGQSLRYQETSLFGAEYRDTGSLTVVGPSPTLRKWYAEVTMRDGVIVAVDGSTRPAASAAPKAPKDRQRCPKCGGRKLTRAPQCGGCAMRALGFAG